MSDPKDRSAGRAAEQLMQDLGALTQKLAAGRGIAQLESDTATFVEGQLTRLREACAACADRLSRDAFADAVTPRTIEMPVRERRSDFVLRLVVAFYPHGVADKPEPGSLTLPRHACVRLGQYLRETMGTLVYADINADAARLMSRFPSTADRDLRTTLFADARSRVLLMKVLVRLLGRLHNVETARAAFLTRCRQESWPNIFRPTEAHYAALCDGLFGEFLVQLQKPQESDDLDGWFGTGSTERVLGLLERLPAPAAHPELA